MKRIILCILSLILLLSGCSTSADETEGETNIYQSADTEGSESESTTEIETEEESETEEKTPIPVSECRIVYPKDCDYLTYKYAKNIAADVLKRYGVIVEYGDDASDDGKDPDSVGRYEILLGNTNRQADNAEGFDIGNDGWMVSSVGDRIIICGASRKGLYDAVEHFLSNYTVEGSRILLDKEKTAVVERNDPLIGSEITLRVGTFNIKHGAEVGLDMSVLAADIASLELDVVGLQEVDVGTRRVGGIDTVKLIAEAAGYQYYEFCKAMDYQGGGYGTAVLSKYPITEFEMIQLEVSGGIEPRAVGHAVLDVNGQSIDFFNTHLSYENYKVQQGQFDTLNELAKDGTAFIITADFNTDNDNYYYRIENSVRANNRKYITYDGGFSSIDDVVIHRNWSVIDCGLFDGESHSDHKLFWAEISYDGGFAK